jgi:hypothetical protein
MSSFGQTKGMNSLIVPLAFLAALLLISGCATSSVLLDTKLLSHTEVRSVEAAKQEFNALRIEPHGGKGNDLIGYVLYRDGVDVRTDGDARSRGKLTLSKAIAEYERYLRLEYMSNQSRAFISEIVREGSVIGYTLIPEGMDVDLWEDISKKDPSKIILILYFEDIRIAD